MSSERLKALLEQARNDFRKHAAEQLPLIAELCDRAGEGDAQALVQLGRIAHQFHGTAGTLGYGDVGDAAREVEAAIASGASIAEVERRCAVLRARIEVMD